MSRQARRVYADDDLPERLEDDRPYNQPGYEPETGRSGGRKNVDLAATRASTSDNPDAADATETVYDAGEVSPWYGGDTGMGDPGTSQEEPEPDEAGVPSRASGPHAAR